MPQKASYSVNPTDGDDDTLARCSKTPDSDDRELEAYAKAVAEFKVTWQKQKRERERKFLKAAQAQLDEHVDRKTREVKGIMNEMEKAYQDFLLEYAAIEDKKRDVLVKITEVQKTLVALSVRKHQETVELTQNVEEGQVKALRHIKQTHQDVTGMVDTFMKV